MVFTRLYRNETVLMIGKLRPVERRRLDAVRGELEFKWKLLDQCTKYDFRS
jgi:hypothetical protein